MMDAMIAKILLIVIVGTIFMSGWFMRGFYEDNKKIKSHCGTATISPTDVPGIYETKITIEDVARLYNSSEAIFTVVHTHEKQ